MEIWVAPASGTMPTLTASAPRKGSATATEIALAARVRKSRREEAIITSYYTYRESSRNYKSMTTVQMYMAVPDLERYAVAAQQLGLCVRSRQRLPLDVTSNLTLAI